VPRGGADHPGTDNHEGEGGGNDAGQGALQLKSNFPAAASTGEITVPASVFKRGRSLIIGDCLITDDRGRDICRVSAAFLLIDGKRQNGAAREAAA